MGKISEEELSKAIGLYQECVPMEVLASDIGVSRQGLWKAFRKAGVETRKGVATRRTIKCDHCGEEFSVTRSRYRSMGRKSFCKDVCYHLYLANNDGSLNRHKQRIARYKVSQVFDLKPDNIVHHKDGNHFNTQLKNFLVFDNNSDHIKYHHALRAGVESEVKPIWDGSGYRGAETSEKIECPKPELNKELSKKESDEIRAANERLMKKRKAATFEFTGGYSKNKQLGKK